MQSYSKLKEVTNIGSAINEKKRTIKGNDEPKSEELKIFKLFIIISWREAVRIVLARRFHCKIRTEVRRKTKRIFYNYTKKTPSVEGFLKNSFYQELIS